MTRPAHWKARHNILGIAFLFFLSGNAAHAEGFINRVGGGIQYGGVIGWQGSYRFGLNAARISLAYFGATVGYERFFASNCSLSFQFFANQIRTTGLGLSYNYHLNSYNKRGWVLGLDVFSAVDTIESSFDLFSELIQNGGPVDPDNLDTERRTEVFISIGYQF